MRVVLRVAEPLLILRFGLREVALGLSGLMEGLEFAFAAAMAVFNVAPLVVDFVSRPFLRGDGRNPRVEPVRAWCTRVLSACARRRSACSVALSPAGWRRP